VTAPTAETLVGAESAPLLLRGTYGQRPFAYLSFVLADSNLPLQLAFPILGEIAVAEIGTQDVLNVLRPLWIGDNRNPPRPETASRVRGRIEVILDAARVDDDAQRANPARWKGHLQHKLPRRSKVQVTRHHPALPYNSMSAFIKALRARDGIAPRALEFVVLTAARTSEALGARWCELDLDAALWTVPAERMKILLLRGGKRHGELSIDRKMIGEMKARAFLADSGQTASGRRPAKAADDVDDSRSRHLSAKVWMLSKRPRAKGATRHGDYHDRPGFGQKRFSGSLC
jgi:integrase